MRASLAELAGLPLLIHTPVWEPRSILCPVQRAPTVFRRTWVGHELRALLLQACPRSSSVCPTKDPAESSEAQLSLGLRNLHLHLSQVGGGCGHEHRARSLAQSAPYRGCSRAPALCIYCVSLACVSREWKDLEAVEGEKGVLTSESSIGTRSSNYIITFRVKNRTTLCR